MEEKIQKKEEHKDVENTFIAKFGFDKVMQLDKETNGIFSKKFHRDNQEVMVMTLFAQEYDETKESYPQGRILNYDEFQERIYEYLVDMKNKGIFRKKEIVGDLQDYDFIQGRFRQEHPVIFIDEELAPELKVKYYQGLISAEDIKENEDLYEILKTKRVDDIFKKRMKKAYLLKEITQDTFVTLCHEYGKYLDNEKVIEKINNLQYKGENIKTIREKINEEIYKLIKDNEIEYDETLPETFKRENIEIFLPEEIEKETRDKFLAGELTFEDVRENEDLEEVLINKDLDIGFRKLREGKLPLTLFRKDAKLEGKLEENWGIFSKEKILKLAGEYGKYLEIIDCDIFDGKKKFEEKKAKIEEELEAKIMSREIKYDDTVPNFFKQKYPKLMLEDEAPAELKNSFYDGYDLDFNKLKKNPDWIRYLIAKDLQRAFPEKYSKTIEILDNADFIKIGIKYLDALDTMVENKAEETLKTWYIATGGRYLPEATVMLNVPENEIEAFLSHSINWLKAIKQNSKKAGDIKTLKESYEIKTVVKETKKVKYSEEDFKEYTNILEKWQNKEEDQKVEEEQIDLQEPVEEIEPIIQAQEEIEEQAQIEPEIIQEEPQEPFQTNNIESIQLQEPIEQEEGQETIELQEPVEQEEKQEINNEEFIELIKPIEQQKPEETVEPKPEINNAEAEETQIEPEFIEEDLQEPVEEEPDSNGFIGPFKSIEVQKPVELVKPKEIKRIEEKPINEPIWEIEPVTREEKHIENKVEPIIPKEIKQEKVEPIVPEEIKQEKIEPIVQEEVKQEKTEPIEIEENNLKIKSIETKEKTEFEPVIPKEMKKINEEQQPIKQNEEDETQQERIRIIRRKRQEQQENRKSIRDIIAEQKQQEYEALKERKQQRERNQQEYRSLQERKEEIPIYDETNMREMVLRIMKRMEKTRNKERISSIKQASEDIKLPETQRIINSIAREYGLDPKTTKVMATNLIAIIYGEESGKTKISDLVTMAPEEKSAQWKECIIELRKALKQIQRIGKEINTTELDEMQKNMIRAAIQSQE